MDALKAAAALSLAIAISLFAAVPAFALEGEEEAATVPPENSAVNQYTEAFPTAGGDREAHSQRGRNISPGKVIGTKNAKKLNQHGAAGHEAAKFAADTAPRTVTEGPSTGTAAGGGRPAGNVTTTPAGENQGAGAGSGGGSGNANSGSGGGNNAASSPQGSQLVVTAEAPEADGSSGISEVLSRATGSSGGEGMGIFLPLLILAAIAWAFAYSIRQRRSLN